jgi:hypothetical protein
MQLNEIFYFIMLPAVIVFLLVLIYVLQKRSKPLEAIHKSLANKLGVNDLIGFSLVDMTVDKKAINKSIYRRILSEVGFLLWVLLLMIIVTVVMILLGISPGDNIRTLIITYIVIGAIIFLFYYGILSFAERISRAKRTKTFYMCVSRSKGIAFFPVTFWSKNFMQKTPNVKVSTPTHIIPIEEIGEIVYQQVEKAGVNEPMYYLKDNGLSVSTSKTWKDTLSALVDEINILKTAINGK